MKKFGADPDADDDTPGVDEKTPDLSAYKTPEIESALDAMLLFDDAEQFYSTCFPNAMPPYRWQVEELLQLSGYTNPYDPFSKRMASKDLPMLKTLQAANGSGKDQIVIAVWALFFICCQRNAYWIGTSASYTQLDKQTWRHIKLLAQQINAKYGVKFLKINKFQIKNLRHNSEIVLFRTDEDTKTEGWHPLVDGGPMAIVLNECKSLSPAITDAFKRCHGYTHWVNISSPGNPIGYFYERCTKYHQCWPAPLVLGKWYHRHITYKDCPHLEAAYIRAVEELGFDHPLVQSSFLALFISGDQVFVVPLQDFNYKYPERIRLPDLPRRAGVDLSLGGDLTVISIWEGNYFVKEIELRERHEPTLTRILYELFKQERLEAKNVYADAGSFGITIIQRLQEYKYSINGVYNQGRALNPKVYANRIAEMAFNFRSMVQHRMLNLENLSDKVKTQAANRLYSFGDDDGKIHLEPKPEYKARHGASPDHFDSALLANSGCNYFVLKAAIAQNTEKVESGAAPLPDQVIEEYKKVYGHTNYKPNGGGKQLWRTSGIERSRPRESVHRTGSRLQPVGIHYRRGSRSV